MNINNQILKLLLIIWSKIDSHQKKNVITLFAIMVVSAVAELFSLGTVIPFLSVITNPDLLTRNEAIASIVNYYNLNDKYILIVTTFVFVVATLITALIRLFNLRMNCNTVASVGSQLSIECYRRILYQPYSIHIKTNSSKVITTLVSNINRTLIALNALPKC